MTGPAIGAKFKLPDLAKVAERVHHNVGEVLFMAAAETERQAKLLAPVDTGRLRASIEARRVSDEESVTRTNVEYARFQEYGTLHQAGKPFLRPAFYGVLNKVKTWAKTILD